MSTLAGTDAFVVNRAGVNYQVTAANFMSTVLDTDLFVVNRSAVNYQVTGLDVKAFLGGGGVVTTPAILSPSRGATNVAPLSKLSSTPYVSYTGATHTSTDWQVRQVGQTTLDIDRVASSDLTVTDMYTGTTSLLIQNTQYEARVRYNTSAGPTGWSEWSNFTTQPVFQTATSIPTGYTQLDTVKTTWVGYSDALGALLRYCEPAASLMPYNQRMIQYSLDNGSTWEFLAWGLYPDFGGTVGVASLPANAKGFTYLPGIYPPANIAVNVTSVAVMYTTNKPEVLAYNNTLADRRVFGQSVAYNSGTGEQWVAGGGNSGTQTLEFYRLDSTYPYNVAATTFNVTNAGPGLTLTYSETNDQTFVVFPTSGQQMGARLYSGSPNGPTQIQTDVRNGAGEQVIFGGPTPVGGYWEQDNLYFARYSTGSGPRYITINPVAPYTVTAIGSWQYIADSPYGLLIGTTTGNNLYMYPHPADPNSSPATKPQWPNSPESNWVYANGTWFIFGTSGLYRVDF